MSEFRIVLQPSEVEYMLKAAEVAGDIMEENIFLLCDYTEADVINDRGNVYVSVSCKSPETLFYLGKHFSTIKWKDLYR